MPQSLAVGDRGCRYDSEAATRTEPAVCVFHVRFAPPSFTGKERDSESGNVILPAQNVSLSKLF